MLINSIIAEVPGKDPETFSAAQRTGNGLETVPGFVAQTGGWADGTIVQAVFLEWWRDTSGYNRFRQMHPEAFPALPRGDYSKISAYLANVIMTVKERDPAKLLPDAAFLRLTDCTLKPRCSPIFMATQLQIWNPAMRSANGMLGAFVSRVDKGLDRFSIASFWKDRLCHERYEQEIFPAVYKQGRASDYLAEMSVYHVPLEKGWCILAPG